MSVYIRIMLCMRATAGRWIQRGPSATRYGLHQRSVWVSDSPFETPWNWRCWGDVYTNLYYIYIYSLLTYIYILYIYILCKYRVLCIHWQTLCSDQIGTASFGLACESTSSWVQLHPRQGLAVLPLRQDMDWRSPMAKKYELELCYILPSILPPWIGFQIGYPMVPRRKNPRVHHRLLRLLVQSGYGSKLLTTFNSLKLDYMIQTI